ncbi:MAG: hypothetical protein JNM00_04470 [Flavobacteriales bacterium]|nr:hypothetical protein [Flavobacteriales bacterium]
MRILTGIFFLLAVVTASAQIESSAFTLTGKGVSTPFATDYHALGINPANLDLPPLFEGKNTTLGLAEFAVSLYSEALTKTELRQNLLNEEVDEFTTAEQREFAREFANTPLAVDIDVMAIGFAHKTQNAGAFGFNVRDRFDYYSEFGPLVSEITMLGYTADYFDWLVLASGDTIPNDGNFDEDTLDIVNGYTNLDDALNIRELIAGTELRMSWVREFNVGYGKRLNESEDLEWYAGIGLKYLVGQGMLKLKADENTATGFSALSPVFDVDYDEIDDNNPSALSSGSGSFTPVGRGFGIDVGITALIDKKLLLSASITDIGSMTWDGNLYSLKEQILLEYENQGIESIDFVDQILELNGSDGLIEWEGKKTYTTKLPMTARLGAGISTGEYLRVGADIALPLGDDVGSLERMQIAVGADYGLLEWLRLSAGFMQGGNYDFKIPAGITFVLANGSYEAGIASRDIVTYFTENQPTVSLSMGFLRFRF